VLCEVSSIPRNVAAPPACGWGRAAGAQAARRHPGKVAASRPRIPIRTPAARRRTAGGGRGNRPAASGAGCALWHPNPRTSRTWKLSSAAPAPRACRLRDCIPRELDHVDGKVVFLRVLERPLATLPRPYTATVSISVRRTDFNCTKTCSPSVSAIRCSSST